MGIILNSGQEKIRQEAVKWFYNSSEQLFEIAGPAGSGKTALIYEILRSLNLKEYEYMPMAYTGQASIVMRTRGFITARSIHSSLYESIDVPLDEGSEQFGIKKKKREFVLRKFIDPNIKLFFIDEAYMVPKFMVRDILSFGIKVIVCGDSNQLPPIGDEPGFLIGENVHRLTELMRQSADNPIIYLANRAIKGEPIHSGQYGNKVLVVNEDEFIPEMIPYADMMICGTNKMRDYLNKYVRQIVGFNSDLPYMGERLICRDNNWDREINGIALTNGLIGTVVNMPDVSKFNGKVFNIDFLPDLVNNACFFDTPVNYEYFIANYGRKNEMKQDKVRRKFLKGEFFEFAYAISVWLAQGSETQKGIYFEEFMMPQIQNQLNYTAITRFKQSMIYITKKVKYTNGWRSSK